MGGFYKSFVAEINKDLEKAQRHRLYEAARHVQKAMKKKASSRTRSTPGRPAGRVSNNLRKGMAFKIPRNDLAIVGYAAPAYHAHLVELGTVKRKKKNGANTGRLLPRPILKPTFKEEAKAVEDILSKRWV